MMNDFLSLADLSADTILELLALADDLKHLQRDKRPYRPLEGKTLAMLFEKPSLRTHLTFEIGIYQLGGHGLFYQTRLGERESVPDVARNIERWVDGIVARTYGHDILVDLAEYAKVPVINALTDREHPCQILADAQALREHKGRIEGLKVAFVGDGNNVFASWAHLAARIPFELVLVCPPGYEADKEIVALAQRETKGSVTITNDLSGVDGSDAVYTDVWASMGQEEEAQEREKTFAPYQVNTALMKRAKSDAVFMHCLPAHRGSEVTDEVMDCAQSIVFDQAENRLHAQKAVMVSLMK